MAKITLPVERAKELQGAELGPSEWRPVTQEIIDAFAAATGDRQWIHVDRERAERESPFRRATIAHGYFTLGLVPVFFWELVELTGTRMCVNYGTNKVRWPAPVPIPSRVRMSGTISEVLVLESGVDLVLDARIEVEGQRKPGMLAQVLYRYYA